MEPAGFETWLAEQEEAIAGGGEDAGAAGVRRTRAAAAATCSSRPARPAQTGPSLDELAASAEEAGKPLEEYVRESIVDPDAYLAAGYPDVMPKTYAELPDDQLDALVQYLTEGAEG